MSEQIVNGYKLLNCLTTGQTSQVWECVEMRSQRHFAMKLLLPEKAGEADVRKMLFHEASVGQELAHPNVIRITAVHKDPATPNFVMEFFPSGSLRTRLTRKQFDFIKEKIHSILKQAATGFAYMNTSGWVHRDVKPENLLVNSAGDLRIIDFAIAQKIEKPSFWSKLFRKKPPIQGTRSYMSPEQIRGGELDGRADIYSFGATAYELTTYRPPFRAASNQELLQKHILEKAVSPQMHNPELSDEFSKLVLHMLEKKPENRPQSFHEVLRVLNAIRIFKTPAKGK